MTGKPLGRRSLLAVSGLIVSVCVVRSSGQQSTPAPQAPAPATVAVDFLAYGADAQPIPDLRAEDLTLKVDGKSRAIHELKYVPGPTALPAGGAALLPPAFRTNASADAGRALILVIDEDSLGVAHLRATQDAAAALMAGLTPQDRVALVTVPRGGLHVDFTTDHARLTGALAEGAAQTNQTDTIADPTCRTQMTLQALTSMLGSLSGSTAPTTVVFLTPGLTGPRGMTTAGAASSALGTAAQTQNACDLQADDFQHVGDAATAARAYFYIGRVDSSTSTASAAAPSMSGRGSRTTSGGTADPAAGIGDLAAATGGEQFQMTSSGNGLLQKVVSETSSYYLVTFEADPAERNGEHHRVELSASRPAATVTTLPSLVIPSAETADAPVTPKAMLRDAKPYHDLVLRATTCVARNESNNEMKLVGLFEPADPLATLTSAMAGLYDQSGHLVTQVPVATDALAHPPVPFAMLIQPGQYRLRIAATDSAGHVGAVDSPVTAKLATAGPLTVSDIVLGISDRSGTFVPELEFAKEPVALAYVEFYGGQADMGVRVAFELATTVNGQPILAVPAAVEATRGSDRFKATASLSIGSLPPGDYVVRAYVEATGQPFGRVERTLKKITQ